MNYKASFVRDRTRFKAPPSNVFQPLVVSRSGRRSDLAIDSNAAGLLAVGLAKRLRDGCIAPIDAETDRVQGLLLGLVSVLVMGLVLNMMLCGTWGPGERLRDRGTEGCA